MSAATLSDKSLPALEEQLARQKAILGNRSLLLKLPDKGAKVQASILQLEAEVEKKRNEVAAKRAQMSPRDIEELEWALGSISFLKPTQSKVPDKDDGGDGDDAEMNPDPLKIIATSQISQRQPKTVIDDRSTGAGGMELGDSSSMKGSGDELDRFSTRIVKTDSRKCTEDTKFVPSKISKTKAAGSASPAGSTTSTASSASKHGEGEGSKSKKWDECLLPPNLSFESAKLLSMGDTITIGSEKCKQIEALKSIAPRTKVYAYDKLREQGMLGSYNNVEMLTSRPVQQDAEDDEFDQDLSDDYISAGEEESELDDDERLTNQKASQDLSKLVNSNLRLN